MRLTDAEIVLHLQAVKLNAERLQQLDRIEAKLDALLKALADEEDEPTNMGLDKGTEAGSRDTL